MQFCCSCARIRIFVLARNARLTLSFLQVAAAKAYINQIMNNHTPKPSPHKKKSKASRVPSQAHEAAGGTEC